MAELSFSASIEVHIQGLLRTDATIDLVVQQLLQHYAGTNLSSLTGEDLQTLGNFLLRAGHYSTLSAFFVQALQRNLPIPWGHFCEALFLSSPAIPETIKSAVIRGADSQAQLEELARSIMLDHFDDRLPILRSQRQKMHQQAWQQRKEEMLATLALLQAQGLNDEEQRLLQKIQLLFPHDAEIEKINQTHLRQRTHELLQEVQTQRHSWIPLAAFQKPAPETMTILQQIEQAMQQDLQNNPHPDSAYNYAIAQVMWENYAAALNFLPTSLILNPQPHKNVLWLRLEILFQLRQFLQMLEELQAMEEQEQQKEQNQQNPEITFAILYWRAQVYFALGEQQQAIEIIESIAAVRPQYRNCMTLLAEWKGQIA